MTYPTWTIDGGVMDASSPVVRDASLDATALPDSASNSNADAGAGALSCTTGIISTVSETALSPREPLTASLRNDGASLGWIALESGKSRAFTTWFGVTGGALFAPPAMDDSEQSTPSIAATSAGFLSVSSDNLAGSVQLRARRTGVTGELVDEEPRSLTNDAADNHTPVLASGADGNILVAWQVRSPSPHGRTMLVDRDGNPLGVAHDVPDLGELVGRAALSPVGTGYLLAWVDAPGRRVHVQRLDAGGLAVGSSSQVDADGHARGNLDLAFTDQGGALVFDVLVDGVRPEVRMRTFDARGFATGNEREVTQYPDTGTWPSLVAVRGGYMLAYRSAQLPGVPDQQLRLALLDARGAPITSAKVAPLTSFDLPLVLRASPDGEVRFLSWLDRLPDINGYQLQRTWIHCD
jgi:hypothetical protein